MLLLDCCERELVFLTRFSEKSGNMVLILDGGYVMVGNGFCRGSASFLFQEHDKIYVVTLLTNPGSKTALGITIGSKLEMVLNSGWVWQQ